MKKKLSKNKFSWMDPRLEVRKAGISGKGIFTNKKIKKGELVCIFGGYVMTLEEEEGLPGRFNDHGVQINEKFVLTVRKNSEIEDAGYFNHSCDPNAGYNGQIFLVAIKNIKKDEEVTFDYAMVLSKAKNANFYKIKCLCGSKNCRGYITENDWKIPELQKRYNGYFQYFLQEKVNKKNKKIKI